jgi:MoaA/NifB/PqqE/SkfB family radical SAM enzyme
VSGCAFGELGAGRLLVWEITRVCNLQCRHCCTMSGPRISRRSELPFATARAVCDELGSVGIDRLLLSGGEPLLRPDVFDLLQAIDVAAVAVFVATNGIALSARTAERLVAFGVVGVDISVDGATAGSHGALRGLETSFGHAWQAVDRAVDVGLSVRVSTVVTPATLPEVDRLADLAMAHGAASLVFRAVEPSAGRAREHRDLGLDDIERERLAARVSRTRNRLAGRSLDVSHRLGGAGEHRSTCPGGRRLLHIAPNGDVSPCPWLYKASDPPPVLGNVTCDSLRRCIERAAGDVPAAPFEARL